MKITEQKFSLSDKDLELLRGSKIIEEMMRNRLLVEFDEAPDLENLDFSGCQSFYHIKSLGARLFQFWFHHIRDYEDFRSNIIAYKMTLTDSDK
jgi:hypothetical protein